MQGDSNDPSDAFLIEASLNDPESFGALYRRHSKAIAKYLNGRVSYDEIENLLADIFYEAFKNRKNFDITKPNALPWLYGIAHNRVLNHYRKFSRRDNAMRRLTNLKASEVDETESFEEIFIDDQTSESHFTQIIAFIQAQSHEDKEVLLMYAWDNLGYEEIAAALQIPTGTVKSRLNRIRAKLKDKFGSSQT